MNANRSVKDYLSNIWRPPSITSAHKGYVKNIRGRLYPTGYAPSVTSQSSGMECSEDVCDNGDVTTCCSINLLTGINRRLVMVMSVFTSIILWSISAFHLGLVAWLICRLRRSLLISGHTIEEVLTTFFFFLLQKKKIPFVFTNQNAKGQSQWTAQRAEGSRNLRLKREVNVNLYRRCTLYVMTQWEVHGHVLWKTKTSIPVYRLNCTAP